MPGVGEQVGDTLARFRPRHEFFIGIDSDGCAFDTMEVKHKECFIPNTIRCFDLQAVSKYAREAAEFVNLYSRWRGINRFPALVLALDLLRVRPEVRARGVDVPELNAVRTWLEHESKPANPGLERACAAASGNRAAELRRVLDWSKAVNASIHDMVRGVPPFQACGKPWPRQTDAPTSWSSLRHRPPRWRKSGPNTT